MGRRSHKSKFDRRWLSAEDRRRVRDAIDHKSRYVQSMGDGEDFDGNHLSTVSSGEGRWENETLSRDNG